MQEHIAKKYREEPRRLWWRLLPAFVFVALMAWSATALGGGESNPEGLAVAGRIIQGIFRPDLNLLFDFSTQGVPFLLLETICIAFLGTLVGAFFSLPLAFLSAENLVPALLARVVRLFIMAIRTIPAFVYGLMFIRVTGPGPFAGLMTMSLVSVGMISKMFTESIEELDPGIMESLDAAGCSAFQKIRYGIWPQLFPLFMSTLIYRFDMNLRDASVLGLVGAGGIGAPLIFAMSAYRWSEVGAILVGLVVLILVIEAFSGRVRMKLVRG